MIATINDIEKCNGFEMRITVTYTEGEFSHVEIFSLQSERFEQMSNQDLLDYVSAFGTKLILLNEKEESYKDLINQEIEISEPEGGKDNVTQPEDMIV